jgi:hypothetical protein
MNHNASLRGDKGMLRIKRFSFVIASLATLSFLAACERSTHVRIEGSTQPVFVLSGSGRLCSFVVYSPEFSQKAKSPSDEDLALWKFNVAETRSTGTPVGSLDRIVYGVLPEGYMQIKPQIGSAPPLKEGAKYFYDVTTTNAPGTAGYFEIKDSRAVSTDGPDTCFGTEGKKWVRVPCH